MLTSHILAPHGGIGSLPACKPAYKNEFELNLIWLGKSALSVFSLINQPIRMIVRLLATHDAYSE